MNVETKRMHWIWAAIVQRCTNPKNKAFHNYGGRGIGICDAWRNDFQSFLADVGHRPSGAVMDRIDNERGYEPGNCRWVNRHQSNANRRISKIVTLNGEDVCLKEACRRLGLKYRPIAKRVQRGWDLQRALAEPLDGRKNAWRHSHAAV